ncbi:MAG: hypothetical protein H7X93_04655 [Sphingomonadaceae bacterium]|nr:hypothetical protein [Sphingomonadaceae bacterium]
MPHYNIELRTHDRVWDTVATETDDLTALRIEMAQFVGELLKDHAAKIWEDGDWRVDVTDDSGLILYVMRIGATDSPVTMRLGH